MTSPWTDIKRIQSTDKNVAKYVYTNITAVAESVLYKYPTYEERTVICCSTQSGCQMGCRFCGAGDNFVRTLTCDEIVSQVDYLFKDKGIDPEKVDKMQIMFMSMGEPMNAWKSLMPALYILNGKYPKAALLISTSAPSVDKNFAQLVEVSQEIDKIGLQFSVHESTDEARDKLIPFKKKMTLKQMAAWGAHWAGATGRRPYFNYCVHENNNKQSDVDLLKELFIPEIWECTLSVICERDESISKANSRQRQLASDFMQKMLETGYSTRMFDPAGQDDVGGGCGQLHFVQQWMKENPDKARPSAGHGQEIVHMPTKITS